MNEKVRRDSTQVPLVLENCWNVRTDPVDVSADALSGGAGIDTIVAGAGNDIVWGDTELMADSLDWMTDGVNYVHVNGIAAQPGQGSDDTIYAGAGDDLVLAEGGDDYVDGGSGNDTLYGGAANDYNHDLERNAA